MLKFGRNLAGPGITRNVSAPALEDVVLTNGLMACLNLLRRNAKFKCASSHRLMTLFDAKTRHGGPICARWLVYLSEPGRRDARWTRPWFRHIPADARGHGCRDVAPDLP